MLVAVCHSEESGWKEVEDLSEISDLRAESGNLLWAEADVSGITPEEIALIAEEFNLDPLAVEDAGEFRQRPKLDDFDRHLFVVFHELDEVRGQLEATQISCFIGDRFVLTLHAGAGRIIEKAKSRWLKDEKRLGAEPGYLVYTLLDVLVDDFETIVDGLDDEIERLEEIVLRDPTEPVQRELYAVKQKLSRLRRYVLPNERVLEWILEGPGREAVGRHSHHYFQDVNDHLLRTADQIRNIDDLTDAVLDLRRAEQATALNEVTKRLTGWAAIITVPTFIASVYGMNFKLVPHDQTIFGFWFAITLMVLSSSGLYLYFKRRTWI
ncbi:MAG: magnesium transporter CorA family protein [Actinobacteria bacterium]|nr:magnesium transporter CorA family protein [Actinomycetota bacterium]